MLRWQAYASFGYWWRPSYGDAWDFNGAQLSDADISALVLEASNKVGNVTLDQCQARANGGSAGAGAPRACLRTWGGTPLPYEAVVGQVRGCDFIVLSLSVS